MKRNASLAVGRLDRSALRIARTAADFGCCGASAIASAVSTATGRSVGSVDVSAGNSAVLDSSSVPVSVEPCSSVVLAASSPSSSAVRSREDMVAEVQETSSSDDTTTAPARELRFAAGVLSAFTLGPPIAD